MSPYLSWCVGMKVVLREGAPIGIQHGWNYPAVGVVYTIRSLFPRSGDGAVCVRLVEVINRAATYPDGRTYEPGYTAEYFRPVHARATDISIFTTMLTTTKKGVDA